MMRQETTRRLHLVVLIYLYIFIYYTFNTGTMRNHRDNKSGWDTSKNVQFMRIIYTILLFLNSVLTQTCKERKNVKVTVKRSLESFFCKCCWYSKNQLAMREYNYRICLFFFSGFSKTHLAHLTRTTDIIDEEKTLYKCLVLQFFRIRCKLIHFDCP